MQVLAFDLGNVLFGFDYNIALNKVLDRLNMSIEKVIDELYYSDLTANFEKGLVTGEEFHLKFNKFFNESLGYDEFVDIWCNIFFPKPEIIDLIKTLKKQYPLYLISNINKLHFEFLHQRYREIFSLFDDLILSYKVKAIKPESAIYQALKAASGVDFEDIIYIDDRADLINEAKAFKIKCIQFSNYQQLISDLNGLGVKTN